MLDIDEDDYMLIRDHLELPFMIDVIELNIRKMRAADFKMGELFILHLKGIRDKVQEEAKQVRIKMRQKSITVYKQIKFKDRIEAKYACRGYQGEMTIRWSEVKSDITEKLAKELEVDLSKLEE